MSSKNNKLGVLPAAENETLPIGSEDPENKKEENARDLSLSDSPEPKERKEHLGSEEHDYLSPRDDDPEEISAISEPGVESPKSSEASEESSESEDSEKSDKSDFQKKTTKKKIRRIAFPPRFFARGFDKNRRKIKKIVKYSAIAVGSAAAAAVLAGTSIYVAAILPVKTELGQPLRKERFVSFPLNTFCEVMTDLDAVDTSVTADVPTELRLFGLINAKGEIQVRDTTAPTAEFLDVETEVGSELLPEDFLLFCADASPVTIAFSEETDIGSLTAEAGIFGVGISLTDSFGNQHTESAVLRVTEAPAEVRIELAPSKAGSSEEGSSEGDPSGNVKKILEAFPGAERILPENTDLSTVGSCRIRLLAGNILKFVRVEVEDTTPPQAEVKDLDILSGQSVSPEDFLVSVTDASEVTVSFSDDAFPDVLTEGTRAVGIEVRDASGNTTHCDTELSVYYAEQAPSFEIGSDTGRLLAAILGKARYRSSLTLPDDFDPSSLTVGENTVLLNAQHGTLPITVTVTDTQPPVIRGVQSITAEIGGSISYFSTVYAEDNSGAQIKVTVDSSAVDPNTPGTYPITYCASDPSGNTKTARTFVTVLTISAEKVNAIADEILASILSPSMGEREKALAVYNWCTANIGYTSSTSYLMGKYYQAAYNSFRARRGNCYGYYAAAALLLTRAGITNIEIHRDDPADPHYWNLVNIGGAWYHFDTCPHFSGHFLNSFLLTDAEVAAYSENEVKNYYSFDSSLYPATP